MVKAVHLKSHVLTDPIILEGIKGVKEIKDKKELQGFIAGGMGVQSYLPEEAYRQTVDLDFSLLWSGNAREFKDKTRPLVDYLKSQDYKVCFRKKGLTYEYVVENDDDSLLVQHQRRSTNHFEKVKKKTLEREVSNQRVVSKGDLNYAVMSPEDLAIHKLARILLFSDNYDIRFPTAVSIDNLKDSSESMRSNILSRQDSIDPEDIARLRLFYDCFDVKCLANHVGLNKPYFEEALKDWTSRCSTDSRDLYAVLYGLEISLD